MALSPEMANDCLHLSVGAADSNKVQIEIIPETEWKPISVELLNIYSSEQSNKLLCSTHEGPSNLVRSSEDHVQLSQGFSEDNKQNNKRHYERFRQEQCHEQERWFCETRKNVNQQSESYQKDRVSKAGSSRYDVSQKQKGHKLTLTEAKGLLSNSEDNAVANNEPGPRSSSSKSCDWNVINIEYSGQELMSDEQSGQQCSYLASQTTHDRDSEAGSSYSDDSQKQVSRKLPQTEAVGLFTKLEDDLGENGEHDSEPGPSTGKARLGQENLHAKNTWMLINVEPPESPLSSGNQDEDFDSLPGPSRTRTFTTILKKPRSIIRHGYHDWKFINVEESVNESYDPHGNGPDNPHDVSNDCQNGREFYLQREAKKHVHFDTKSDCASFDVYEDIYPVYTFIEKCSTTTDNSENKEREKGSPLILGMKTECVPPDLDILDKVQTKIKMASKKGKSQATLSFIINRNASANNSPKNHGSDGTDDGASISATNAPRISQKLHNVSYEEEEGAGSSSTRQNKSNDYRCAVNDPDLLQKQTTRPAAHQAKPQSFTEQMVALFNNLQTSHTTQTSPDKYKRKEQLESLRIPMNIYEKPGCVTENVGTNPTSIIQNASDVEKILSPRIHHGTIDSIAKLQRVAQVVGTSKENTAKSNQHSIKAILLVLHAMQTILVRMAKLAAEAAGIEDYDENVCRSHKMKAPFKFNCPKDREVMPDGLFAYSIAHQVVGQAFKKISELYPDCIVTVQTDAANNEKVEQNDSVSNVMALTAMKDALKDLEGPSMEKTYASTAVETSDSLTNITDGKGVYDAITNENKGSESIFIALSIISELLDNVIIMSVKNKDDCVGRSVSEEEVKKKNELLLELKSMSFTLVAKTMREAVSVLMNKKTIPSHHETPTLLLTKVEECTEDSDSIKLTAPCKFSDSANVHTSDDQSAAYFMDSVSEEVHSLISRLFEHLQSIDCKKELCAIVTESETNNSRSTEYLYQNKEEKYVQTELQLSDDIVESLSSHVFKMRQAQATENLARNIQESIEPYPHNKNSETTPIPADASSSSFKKSLWSTLPDDSEFYSYRQTTYTSASGSYESAPKDEVCRSDDSTKCITLGSKNSTVDHLSDHMSDLKLSSAESQMSSVNSNSQSHSSNETFEYSTPSNLLEMRLLEEQRENSVFGAPTLFGNLRFARSSNPMFMPPGRVQMVGGNHPEHVQQADVNRPSCSKIQGQAYNSRQNSLQKVATSYSVTNPISENKRRGLTVDTGYGLAHHYQRGAKNKNNRSVSEPKLDFYKRTKALDCPKLRKKLFSGTDVESSEWMLVGNDTQSYSATSNNDSSELEDEDVFTVEFGEGVTSEEAELIMGIIFPMPHEILRQDIIQDGLATQVQSETNTCFNPEDKEQDIYGENTSATGLGTLWAEESTLLSENATSEESATAFTYPYLSRASPAEGRCGRENPTPDTALHVSEYDELTPVLKDIGSKCQGQCAAHCCSSYSACACKGHSVHSHNCSECKSSSSIPSTMSECQPGCLQNMIFQPISSDKPRECTLCLLPQIPTPTNCNQSPDVHFCCCHQARSITACNHSSKLTKKRPETASPNHSVRNCTCRCQSGLSSCSTDTARLKNCQENCAKHDRVMRGSCKSQNCSTSPDRTSDDKNEQRSDSNTSVHARDSFIDIEECQQSYYDLCPCGRINCEIGKNKLYNQRIFLKRRELCSQGKAEGNIASRESLRCHASVCSSQNHSFHCHNAPMGIHPCHIFSTGINPCHNCSCHADSERRSFVNSRTASLDAVKSDHCYSFGSKFGEQHVKPSTPLRQLHRITSTMEQNCRRKHSQARDTSCCQHCCSASCTPFNHIFTCHAGPCFVPSGKCPSSSADACDYQCLCEQTCTLPKSCRKFTNTGCFQNLGYHCHGRGLHGGLQCLSNHCTCSDYSDIVCECSVCKCSSTVCASDDAACVSGSEFNRNTTTTAADSLCVKQNCQPCNHTKLQKPAHNYENNGDERIDVDGFVDIGDTKRSQFLDKMHHEQLSHNMTKFKDKQKASSNFTSCDKAQRCPQSSILACSKQAVSSNQEKPIQPNACHRDIMADDPKISFCPSAIPLSTSVVDVTLRAIQALFETENIKVNQDDEPLPALRVVSSNVDGKNLLVHGKTGITHVPNLCNKMLLNLDAAVQAETSVLDNDKKESKSQNRICSMLSDNDPNQCTAFLVCVSKKDSTAVYIQPVISAEKKIEYENCACQVSTVNLCEIIPNASASDTSDVSVARSTGSDYEFCYEDEDVPEDEQCRYPSYETGDAVVDFKKKKKSRRTHLSPNRISIVEEVCEISHSGCETCFKKTSPAAVVDELLEANVLHYCSERNNHRCPTSNSDLEINFKEINSKKKINIYDNESHCVKKFSFQTRQTIQKAGLMEQRMQKSETSDRIVENLCLGNDFPKQFSTFTNLDNPDNLEVRKRSIGDRSTTETFKWEGTALRVNVRDEAKVICPFNTFALCNNETSCASTKLDVEKHLSRSFQKKTESDTFDLEAKASKSEINAGLGNWETCFTSLHSSSSSSTRKQSTPNSSDSDLNMSHASSCGLSMARTASCLGYSISGLDLRTMKKMVSTCAGTNSLCSDGYSKAFGSPDSTAVSLRHSQSEEMIRLESGFGDSRDTWTSLQMLNLTSRATRMVLEHHLAALHLILKNMELTDNKTDASVSHQLISKSPLSLKDTKMILDNSECQNNKHVATSSDGPNNNDYSKNIQLTANSSMNSHTFFKSPSYDQPVTLLNDCTLTTKPLHGCFHPTANHTSRENNPSVLFSDSSNTRATMIEFSAEESTHKSGLDSGNEQESHSKCVPYIHSTDQATPVATSSFTSSSSHEDEYWVKPCSSEELIRLVNQRLDGLKEKLLQYSEEVSRGASGSLNTNTNNCPAEACPILIQPIFRFSTNRLNNLLSSSFEPVITTIRFIKKKIRYDVADVDNLGFPDFYDYCAQKDDKGVYDIELTNPVNFDAPVSCTQTQNWSTDTEQFKHRKDIQIFSDIFKASKMSINKGTNIREIPNALANFSNGFNSEGNRTRCKGVQTHFSKNLNRGMVAKSSSRADLVNFNDAFCCMETCNQGVSTATPGGSEGTKFTIKHNEAGGGAFAQAEDIIIKIVSDKEQYGENHTEQQQKLINQYRAEVKLLERALKLEKDLHEITRTTLHSLARDHNDFRARICSLKANR